MDFTKWLEEAKFSINTKVKAGIPFEVKELFDGVKWNELSKGERSSFGRYFSNEVKEGNIEGIKFLGRKDNNHNKYEKL